MSSQLQYRKIVRQTSLHHRPGALHAADMVQPQHFNRGIPFYMIFSDTREGGHGCLEDIKVPRPPITFPETDLRAAQLLITVVVVVVVVVVVDSHIQRIVLATKETTVTQHVSHRPIKCRSRLWSQRGTKVNGSHHHGGNPLLRPNPLLMYIKL